jgi:ABC-2 type transport system ATP-binding protein
MSLLEVSNLRKSFGNYVAVNDLSFRVEAGEIFGLLGPNGAGKSTTMMMLAGLRRPDGGTISIDGRQVVEGDKSHQTLLGVVPQDLAVYPDLTAFENLDFFARIYGVRGDELQRRITRILDDIGLTEHAHQLVHTFSGGMKRRLNFGVALLHDPKLVILDEPTVGVDPQSRSHLLDCVRQLSAKGVGVIYASHYMEEVEAVCQRVAIIDHGKLLKIGTLDELLDATRSDITIRVGVSPEKLRPHVNGLAELVPLNGGESQVIIRRGRTLGAVDVTRRLEQVLEVLQREKAELYSIETQEHNLERLFLDLTGQKLRD